MNGPNGPLTYVRSFLDAVFAALLPWSQRYDRWLRRSPRVVSASLALVAAFFALRAMLAHGLEHLGVYDEALLFTDAFLMDRGRVIYRDFYINYPPGILQIVRAITALGLPPIWSERFLTVLVRVASALVAGRLAVRGEPRRICLATFALVLVLQSGLTLALYAYVVAVLWILLGIVWWSRSDGSLRHALLSGAWLGALSYLRHDLFVYALLLFGPLEALAAVLYRRSLWMSSPRQALQFAAATATTALVLWLPPLVMSGPSRIVHDIVIDQAQRTMPGRALPVPSFAGQVNVPTLGLSVPTWASDHLHVCLLIAALAVLVIVIFLPLRVPAWGLQSRAARSAFLLCGFALCTLPQALQRVDYTHAAFGVPLTVAAVFALQGSRFAATPLLLLSLVPWFLIRPNFVDLAQAERLWTQRDDSQFLGPDRLLLAQFVGRELTPEEPLFVGCGSHRKLNFNPLDLYYVTQRTGATRYMQFDPGTVTSEDGQQAMIADLERTRPRLTLKQPNCAWFEPNTSQIEGSGLLDDYLAQHYAPDGSVAGLQVWRRK